MVENSLESRMRRHRWGMFALFGTAYLLAAMHRMVTAVIAGDLAQSFDIAAVALGALGSAFFYPFTLGAILAGLAADRTGPRRLAGTGLALAGAGAILFGLAPDFRAVITARAITGAGLGGILTAAVKYLVNWFGAAKLATAYGILAAIGYWSGLSRYFVWPLAYVKGQFGWRSAVVLLGLATLGTAAAIYRQSRDDPRGAGLPKPGWTMPEEGRKESQPVQTALRNRYAWIMYVYGIIAGGVWGGLQGTGTFYLMYVQGLGRVQADRLLILAGAGAVIAAPLGGYVSDRLQRRKLPALAATVAGIIGWAGLSALPAGLPPVILRVIFFALGFAHGFGTGALLALKLELFPRAMAGAVLSVSSGVSLLGGLLYPVQPAASWIMLRGMAALGVYRPESLRLVAIFYAVNLGIGLAVLTLAKETGQKADNGGEFRT